MNPSGNQTPTNGSNSTTNATPNYNTGYNYSAPNLNASSVGGQTANGVSNVGGYQMPDYTGIASTNNANQQAFNNSQQNTIGAFTGAYNSAVGNLPTYQQLNNQANQQYNVPGLTTQAANLNAQVLQIPQTYSQATQGSDTNSNQLSQLINQKQWELDPLAAAATSQAQAAQGLANTMVGYGVQNEAQQLSPYAAEAPMIQNQLASAATNFGQAQSDQLSALESAVQAGAQLSGDQLTQLASLQNAQTAYNQAVAVANIGQQTALNTSNLANKYAVLNPAQTLVNTETGGSQVAA